MFSTSAQKIFYQLYFSLCPKTITASKDANKRIYTNKILHVYFCIFILLYNMDKFLLWRWQSIFNISLNPLEPQCNLEHLVLCSNWRQGELCINAFGLFFFFLFQHVANWWKLQAPLQWRYLEPDLEPGWRIHWHQRKITEYVKALSLCPGVLLALF